MRKNILNRLLFIAVLSLFNITNTVQAQSVNKITISVKDIQYDDPNFTALRETLKKNPKVKLVKPSYTSGVAILSFTYAGEASQLWEEIPKSSKRFFNLGELGDDAISLNYINPKKNEGNSSAVTNAAQTKTTNKKDCFDCDYFPLCKYDVTKTFGGGHVYRGIQISDDYIEYFNCENGIVTKKWVTSFNPKYKTVDYDPFNKIQTEIYYEGQPVYTTHTEIVLNSHVPEGEGWEGEKHPDDWKGAKHRFMILERDIPLVVDGIKYDNVIAVSDKYAYYLYAKGIGLIKKVENDNEYNKIMAPAKLAHGIIDQDIVGTWIRESETGGWERCWKFNADGTGKFSHEYTTFGNLDDSAHDVTINWRILYKNVLFFIQNPSSNSGGREYKINKSLPAITIDGYNFNKYTIDPSISTIVDTPAMFPGGHSAWAEYAEQNISKTLDVGYSDLEVKIKFTVTKDGTLKDFIPVTNYGYQLQGEVIKLLMNGPKWIPAKKNGESVNSIVILTQVIKKKH
jgi:hypothetical protein